MVCIECGGELTPQKKAFNCHSCEGKTAAILERLEEYYQAYSESVSNPADWFEDRRVFELLHHIKTGRMMTEEDLKGDQNVD